MSPGRRRSHAESESDRDLVLRALVDHRHGIRWFLALFAANRTQIEAAESALWKAWLARPSDASATGIRAGLQRLAAEAIARQLDASAASALAGQDPLAHLLSQSGREALQRPSGSDEGAAHQVQSRMTALDPELQELLRGRYGERQSNADQAARLGCSSARVDARLHWARNALDWTAPLPTTVVADAAEGLLPTLIEDYLAGTMDADSRALLVKRAMDDMQVATRVERQVRLDLILGELLTQFTPADHAAFAERLAAEPEAEPIQRSPGSNPRRSAALPAARPAARQRAPVPIPVIGAVVLGCVVAVVVLLVMARPSVPSTTAHPTAVRTTATEERLTAVTKPSSSVPPSLATATPATPVLTTVVSAPNPPAPMINLPTTSTPVPVATTEIPATTAIPLPLPPVPVAAVAATAPAATAPAATARAKPAPVFVKGIHFGSEAVTIAGNRWQSLKQAEDDGLTLRNSRRVMVSLSPVPAVDADTRSLLISGIAAAKSEPLGISLALPDGDYDVAVWMMENQRANSRLFDLDIGGVALTNVGDLPLGGWATYGPCAVQVRGGKLEITSKAQRGIPMLMGLTIHRTAASMFPKSATYIADFSAGVAKDWAPVSGAWSVVAGNYIHTSADGIHLSTYEGATWGDLTYSASLFPRFDNAYGLVFGFQDAQTYDALTIVNDMATLQRVTKGVTTQVAQAACQATSKWKWSAAIVTRVGRKVWVSINQTPVFTDIDLGEAAVGKIGLYTAFCQADFGALSVTPPRR